MIVRSRDFEKIFQTHLTLSLIMLKNGQTYSKNLAVFTQFSEG